MRYRYGDRHPEPTEGAVRHDEVASAARAQGDAAAQFAGPYSGCVHHGPRTEGDRGAGEHVDRGGSIPVDGSDRAVRDDPCAVPGRCPGDRDDQTRVVDELAVPGQQPAAQPGGPQGRHHGLGLDRAQPSRPRQHRPRGAGATPDQVGGVQAGVGDQSSGGGETDHQRKHHRQRPHQVWRGGAQQDVAFPGALAGQRDVAGGQVAQSAVDELGAPPAGAEGQVVGFQERDGQPAARGIQCHTRPGHPAADDENVDDGTARQIGEIPIALPAIERPGRLRVPSPIG